MAGNLLSDFGEQSVIFERGDKYVIAIFDNVNDLNVFKGGLK